MKSYTFEPEQSRVVRDSGLSDMKLLQTNRDKRLKVPSARAKAFTQISRSKLRKGRGHGLDLTEYDIAIAY
jgi:hypothetical protein